MEREEFIRKTLRLGILAAFAGTTTFLASKKRINLSCTDNGICSSCSVYGVCNLEKAIKAREDER
jgi:hypothetical protein